MSLKVQKNVKVKFTRITLDKNLEAIVQQVQQELPLFSISDVMKLLLSKGIQSWKKEHQERSFAEILRSTVESNPHTFQKKLSEEEMFEEWRKFQKKKKTPLQN